MFELRIQLNLLEYPIAVETTNILATNLAEVHQPTTYFIYSHLLRSVHTRRQVAGDTSQWQIAACVLENFYENLRLQQNFVTATSRKNQIRLNLCDLLWQQNFVAVTTIFTKILQYTPNNSMLKRVAATCCCNLSPSVYRPLWSMLTIYSCYIQFQFLLITALTYFHEIYQNDPPGNDLLSENDPPKPISKFWKWLPSKMAACPLKKKMHFNAF